MQSGASDLTPDIFSKSSIDDPTSDVSPLLVEGVAGEASIFTATGAATTAGAFGLSTTLGAAVTGADEVTASGVYSPVSSARWRSVAVYKPIAERVSYGR